MKPLLPSNNTRIDGSTHLIEDGKVITEPSSVFNSYFMNPVVSKSVLNYSEDDFSDHPSIVAIRKQAINLEFSFEPVNCEYIAELLNKLTVKKSCGPDGIPPKLLKISTPAIAAPLTNLFNFYISSSTWPKEWN